MTDHFDLSYDLDPTDYNVRGDRCGKCREAIVDPATNHVQIIGIK